MENQDVRGIFHPRLVDADLRTPAVCLVVSYLVAVSLLPVVGESSMRDVDEDWAHFLLVLADDLLLTSLLVKQLGHCDV